MVVKKALKSGELSTEKEVLKKLDAINNKLDMLLDLFGLGDKRRMTPREREEWAKATVEKWRKRQALKTMKVIDPTTGRIKCEICGDERIEKIIPRGRKHNYCVNKCSFTGKKKD